MNNQFSLKRLCHYAKADMVTNRRKYLLSLALVATVAMVLHYISYISTQDTIIYTNGQMTSNGVNFTNTYGYIVFFLVAIITFYISKSFNRFYNKGYASANLMLPVSNAEKFTYISVWNLLIYPVTLTFVAWLVAQGWAWSLNLENNLIYFINILNIPISTFISKVIATLILLILIPFVGSIIFRRMQYLFTLIISITLFILVMSFESNIKIFQFLIENTWTIFIIEIIMLGFVYWRFKRLQITK